MFLSIYNLEPEHFSRDAIKELKKYGNYYEAKSKSSNLDEKILSESQILITRLNRKIDLKILKKTPRLKFIVTATTGLNHLDIKEISKRNISIISLKGETRFLKGVFSTAELNFGLIIELARKIKYASKNVSSGKWDRDFYRGFELQGKKIGIIGFGRIGKILSKYCLSFGMEVLVNDIKRNLDIRNKRIKKVSLNKLLNYSDIISLNINYDERFINFIDKRKFELMSKKPFFINTSRGELVNEIDLLEALTEKKIKGAAIDVLADENIQLKNLNDHPLIKYSKINENSIITPHIGGSTFESLKKTEDFVVNKLLKKLKKDKLIYNYL